jgi:hypothetical protein
VLEHLAEKLTARYERGFSRRNLDDMRRFYLGWPIRQTLAAKSIWRTASAKSEPPALPLPWSRALRAGLSCFWARGRHEQQDLL